MRGVIDIIGSPWCMFCKFAGKDARSLSNETLCFGVSLPTELSDSLAPDADGKIRCACVTGDESMDGSGVEVVASRLCLMGRVVPRTRLRLGEV